MSKKSKEDEHQGIAHTGVCKKCSKYTWIRNDTLLCTEPPNSCHFKENV